MVLFDNKDNTQINQLKIIDTQSIIENIINHEMFTQQLFNNLNKGNLPFSFKHTNTLITPFQQFIQYLLSDEIINHTLLYDLFTKNTKKFKKFYKDIFELPKSNKLTSFGKNGYLIIIIEIITLVDKLITYFKKIISKNESYYEILTNYDSLLLIVNNK